MINLTFYYGTEIVFIRVKGNDIKFSTSLQQNKWATIEGLKLDYAGCIREFPELELSKNWREEVIFRFKQKIKSLKTENDKAKYIISDLKKYGYIPKWKQKAGFRREAIN